MTVNVVVTDMDGTFLDDAKQYGSCTLHGAIPGTEKT